MGANLSVEEPFADTSGVVWAPQDQLNYIIMAIIWGCALYGLGMIWCAVQLLSRWSGRHGERGVNIFSILAAFLLSTAWPPILLYLWSSGPDKN